MLLTVKRESISLFCLVDPYWSHLLFLSLVQNCMTVDLLRLSSFLSVFLFLYRLFLCLLMLGLLVMLVPSGDLPMVPVGGRGWSWRFSLDSGSFENLPNFPLVGFLLLLLSSWKLFRRWDSWSPISLLPVQSCADLMALVVRVLGYGTWLSGYSHCPWNSRVSYSSWMWL